MKRIQGQDLQPLPGSVLTIGNFDGVHLGHQRLLRELVARARQLAQPAVVLTFDPHPVQVLYPERRLSRLFDWQDQEAQLRELGVDILVVESFSRNFAQMSPKNFVCDYLWPNFHPRAAVVGYDFSFGAKRSGNIESLRQESEAMGFAVSVVPAVEADGQVVSSSLIRRLIGEGDVSLAARMLGRRYFVPGEVVRGAGRGKSIGIPTANLETRSETWPALGVYCGWVEIMLTREWYPAVINIGHNPTFGAQAKPRIEAHLLSFDGDLYGQSVRVHFVDYLRAEEKFASAADLQDQIRRDIVEGMRRL